MNITLAAAQRRFVGALVESGRYVDESEVVRAALRHMEAQVTVAEARATYTVLGPGADTDIEALAFIVMMEAVKSANEDLKAIMEKVKAINRAKAALREALGKVNKDVAANATRCVDEDAKKLDFSRGLGSERAYHRVSLPCPDPDAPGGVRYDKVDLYLGRITTAAELEAVQDALENKLDSLSDLSEETALRLQSYLERRSKFTEMLSNLLKKQGDTAASIVQNLK